MSNVYFSECIHLCKSAPFFYGAAVLVLLTHGNSLAMISTNATQQQQPTANSQHRCPSIYSRAPAPLILMGIIRVSGHSKQCPNITAHIPSAAKPFAFPLTCESAVLGGCRVCPKSRHTRARPLVNVFKAHHILPVRTESGRTHIGLLAKLRQGRVCPGG